MPTTKNIVAISTLLGTLIAPSAVLGAETLYVAGVGGSIQKTIEEKIVPGFEARTGAKVAYVPGSSADVVAKLIAQKGHQDISLILIDGGPMFRAVEQNLCAPLPNSTVLSDVYPSARMPGGTAVGYGFYATGLGYNKDVFAKNGWPAPTSWNDLGDPKYKGKVSIGPISGYGVEALVMLARSNGGSEKNIEPGFEIMAKKVAPNVLSWEASQATQAQMFQSGEAAMIVSGNVRVQPIADQGAPVAFVHPKEGARQGMGTVCVVEGGPQPKLAQQFLDEMLSPTAQVELAKGNSWGPVNTKVKLDADVASKVIYGTEQVNALVPLDWSYINAQLPEWTKRWNREVER